MKKVTVALCLAFCALAIRAQSQQPMTSPAPAVGAVVSVHVVASHVTPCWATACRDQLYLDVVLNGKKYELRGDATGDKKMKIAYDSVLAPGDYQAKLTKDEHSATGMFYQEYELLLPGNYTWKGVVSGVSE